MAAVQLLTLVLTAVVLILVAQKAVAERTFVIDYDHDTFLKDGKPFRYISGSMHYSRVPSQYWKDRLSKMRAAGLNAVQTYVPWNFHEPSPGVFRFDGDRDLVTFIKTAASVDLLVILRAGPYICAEWDMGGLPSWLLEIDGIVLRSSDKQYISYVDKWFDELLPRMKPLLYENGGPIITVQVENEYGSYFACDHNYMTHLEDLFRSQLGKNVVLFTTDGNSDYFLKCGTLSSLYSTVDFGVTNNVEGAFKAMRDYQAKGPLVNSEFYTGWLDYWGSSHSRVSTDLVVNTLKMILQLNASVNMYMFEGGTNFGFWNGADEPNGLYLPVPTSYDYDAPLSEAGDPTAKYMAIRELLKTYSSVPDNVPLASLKSAYGVVKMSATSHLIQDMVGSPPSVTSSQPKTFEDLQHSFGFMLYESTTTIVANEQFKLTISGLHDRASVYWGNEYQGVLMRKSAPSSDLMIKVDTSRYAILHLIVENMGRVNYGSQINDSKGILGKISVNDQPIVGWTSTPIALSNLSHWNFHTLDSKVPVLTTTAFFSGHFTIKGTPTDTYLSMNNWSKGVAIINGFILGRYWPTRGPQKTLYVPANVLVSAPQVNNLTMLELDQAPCKPPFEECFVSFVSKPDIG